VRRNGGAETLLDGPQVLGRAAIVSLYVFGVIKGKLVRGFQFEG
jgi:hypothetical protein